MITKSDYKTMILSHPANNIKKWKLNKMVKGELVEHWNELIADKNYIDEDSGETLLYSDIENDFENVMQPLKIDYDPTINDDIYDRIKNEHKSKKTEEIEDEENEEQKEDIVLENDNTLTREELKKEIGKIKSYFKNRIKKTKNYEMLIEDVNVALNDVIDDCVELSTQDENDILSNFEDFMNRYI